MFGKSISLKLNRTPGLTLGLLLFGGLWTTHVGTVQAQEVLKHQSSARPFGLDIVGKVNAAASDGASSEFFNEALPEVSRYLNSKLGEQVAFDDTSMLLDPTKLQLQNASDVRVYFVGEGAGYHNTLGFNTTGKGVESGNPQLIFPDASSRYFGYSSSLAKAVDKGKVKRSGSTPLAPGDFVDLGTVDSGSTLDFFLIANGANGGKNVYSSDASSNPDGINHLISFAYATPGSSYLVLGFEDLYGGGDRDFNDLLFAVDIGASNIAALTATPEPGTMLTISALIGIAGYAKRRRRGEEMEELEPMEAEA